MAGRDNVLFSASVASSTVAGTVVPLSLAYGIENVRQGYGTPVLKNVRAFFHGMYGTNIHGVPIEIKNSNWTDAAGVIAQAFSQDTSLGHDSLGFMRGRDKELIPNTSWIINAELPATTVSAGKIYVLFEIEYSAVPGLNTEKMSGSPVFKKCSNASVTLAADTVGSIGSFDNLLQNIDYYLSEVSVINPEGSNNPFFVILEGFSNQRGLVRIIPAKCTGTADQVEGSVILTKQTYSVSVLSYSALSAASVIVGFEMIASKN